MSTFIAQSQLCYTFCQSSSVNEQIAARIFVYFVVLVFVVRSLEPDEDVPMDSTSETWRLGWDVPCRSK